MMKGFFRGLRCMFDTDNEKEPEIQIGAPTDVKHVAHIGCDGPSTPAPSWMHEYQGESKQGETNAGSKDHGSSGGATESLSHPHKARQSRRSSHGNESSNANHKPRKNRSTNNESSANESSRTRRTKNSVLESDQPEQETNVKKTRKKQGDETTRSSKTRNKDPSTNHSG